MSTIKPSPQQRDFFRQLLETNKNVAMQATAGSGKTTTIVMASKLIPRHKDSIFLAFNNKIVDELKEKLPSHFHVSTLHSFGFKALLAHNYTKFYTTEFKTMNLMGDLPELKKLKPKEQYAFKYGVQDLINMARMTLTPMEEEALQALGDQYDISTEYGEPAATIKVMEKLNKYNQTKRSKHETSQYDFTDMVYQAATRKDIKVKQYDYVFLDEAQDLNACQHALLERILKPNGRLISVGDKRQAIYSFAGADVQSFQRLAARPNTIELPLSVSYRCPLSVVELARTVYTDIEPWEHAKEGIVREGSVFEVQEGDIVLCRNNKPLIELFFDLLDRGIKSKILGNEIGKDLLNLLKKVEHLDVPTGKYELNEQLSALELKLTERGIRKPLEHKKYVALQEKVLCINIIAKSHRHMRTVGPAIEGMFSDKTAGVTLMSIHKSKGLEAKRVFLLRPDLLPSSYAVKPSEIVAEQNLRFVAYTRAQEEFVFAKEGVDQEKISATFKEDVIKLLKEQPELIAAESDV